MSRQTLSFIALAISMLYGIGFAVLDASRTYAVVGAVVVALAWVAVMVLGRDSEPRRDRDLA